MKRVIKSSHISHKHRGAQSSCLKAIQDLMWDVGIVGDGRRDVHHSWTAFSTPSSREHSSTALQHPPSVLTIRVLKHIGGNMEVRSLLRKTLLLSTETPS